MDVEPKIGGKIPKMDGENNGKPENPMNKWMIWGYHYFWKHPYIPSTQLTTSIFEGTQPSKTRLFFSNQNKGPHLGSRYIYIIIYIYTFIQYIDLRSTPHPGFQSQVKV